MQHQNHAMTAGRPTVATSRRRWAQRVVSVAAAAMLGLLPGLQGLAPAPAAIAQAAPSDQPDAAPPTSAPSDTAPPTRAAPALGQAPTRDVLDTGVVSTGAPDEQLDMRSDLDQGARLFSLRAHYQDWGDGQDDYYLAGSDGVSHQPLSDVFVPLADWLAAPEHAGQGIALWLATDPRSA